MEKEYRIVAVDFDCTIAVNDAYPFAGRPNMTAIKILREYRRRGNKLILWTCRVGEALQNALDMCAEHGLEFDAVNDNLASATRAWRERYPGIAMSRKVYAEMYIDDRDPHAILHGIDWDAVCRLLLHEDLETFLAKEGEAE